MINYAKPLLCLLAFLLLLFQELEHPHFELAAFPVTSLSETGCQSVVYLLLRCLSLLYTPLYFHFYYLFLQ